MTTAIDAVVVLPLREASIMQIEQALVFGEPWLDASRTDAWLLGRMFGASSFIALAGERPLGVAVAAVEHDAPEPALYIHQAAVAPTHRRRGLARALLQRCVAAGRQAGARGAWLTADPANPAVAWWVALGFVPTPSPIHQHGWPVQLDFKGVGRHRVLLVMPIGEPKARDEATSSLRVDRLTQV
jgi:aminoglycoside 3-N-acetyltransferase I